MSLFSFTYKHPRTKELCTVDSGKPTRMTAFIDILRYMRRIGFRKLAPKSAPQIKDESLRTVHSSHGVLTTDARGIVINRCLDNDDADGGGHLARILRFDIGEWSRHWGRDLPECFDILDLAYWYADVNGVEVYAPPEETWRSDIAHE
jgi:hypothetical protein